ncbi:MAG TPA: hypothetical protein VKE74_33410 [Gemmataceae bacterium]|nr:hypothetical protein [Gemmataceae bacterium]
MSKVEDPLDPTISLPNSGETLSPQFSVFGTCDTKYNPVPTVAVKVKNGETLVKQGDASVYQSRGTYEAIFDLDPNDPNLQHSAGNVKVVILYDGKETAVYHDRLSIQTNLAPNQTTISIGAPLSGDILDKSTFTARGNLGNCSGGTVYARLTLMGNDILIQPQSLSVGDTARAWNFDFSAALKNNAEAIASDNYNLHVSIWNSSNQEVARVCSGFFRLQ